MKRRSKTKKIIEFSVGICAYNEEKNIGRLIRAIFNQKLPPEILLEELIVVASGCTDRTEEIVRQWQKKRKEIILISEKERKGKIAAVNKFISKSKTDYLVLESADTLPEKNAFRILLETLKKGSVGMVGAHIIPLNEKDNFLGFNAHLLWSLHHKINLQFPERPKVGEIIAFKKIFRRIPRDALVDEASIEPLIHGQGYKVVYCPEAVIYNKGPETIRDFIRQRRRNYAGHIAIRKRYGYAVVTYSNFRILGTLLANIEWNNWRFFVFTPIVVALETFCRLLGGLDLSLKLRDHHAWKMAISTKKLITKGK